MTLKINLIDNSIVLSRPKYLKNATSWLYQFPLVLYLVSLLKPRLIVEIGKQTGDSYCTFCQVVDELNLNCQCYGINELRESEAKSDNNSRDSLADFQEYHDSLYGHFSRVIQSGFDDALKRFSYGSIDLLHINGLDAYQGVMKDLEALTSKMSDRGVVLLHGINAYDFGSNEWQLYSNLKSKYPHLEFIHGQGLGLLGIGLQQVDTFQELFESSSKDVAKIRNVFAKLGYSWDYSYQADLLRQQAEEDLHQEQETTRTLQQELALSREHQELLSVELDDTKFGELQLQEELEASQGLVSELRQELDSVRQAHQQELDSVRDQVKELENLLEAHQQELDSVRDQVKELENLLEQHRGERVAQDEAHQQELDSVRQTHQQELDSVIEELESLLEQHEGELVVRDEAHQQELDSVRQAHQQELDSVRDQVKELENLLEQQRGELVVRDEAHQQELESVRQAHQQELDSVHQAHRQQAQERLQFHEHLVRTATTCEEIQYQVLVWEGWCAYRDGDWGQMVRSLQQSATFTSLDYVGVIRDWLQCFTQFSSDQLSSFDAYDLIQSEPWQRLLKSLQHLKKALPYV